jgi:transcriptional regulator with XRE-family HTH domain
MDEQTPKWRLALEKAIKLSPVKWKPMAREAGLGETFIRDFMERGQVPSVENFLKLCRYFGIDPAGLFEGEHISDEHIAIEMERTALARAFKEATELEPPQQRVVLEGLRGILAAVRGHPGQPQSKPKRKRAA